MVRTTVILLAISWAAAAASLQKDGEALFKESELRGR